MDKANFFFITVLFFEEDKLKIIKEIKLFSMKGVSSFKWSHGVQYICTYRTKLYNRCIKGVFTYYSGKMKIYFDKIALNINEKGNILFKKVIIPNFKDTNKF